MFSLIKRTAVILKPVTSDSKVRKLFAVNIGLISVTIALIFTLTRWREYFIGVIQAKDVGGFITALTLFALIAGGIVAVRGYQAFMSRKIEFRSRELIHFSMADKLVAQGMVTDSSAPEQRIAQDAIRVPQLAASLVFGLYEALVGVVVFGITVLMIAEWYAVPAVILYVALGIAIASKIGRPLVQLDYTQQSREAALYRKLMAWVHEGGKVPTLDAVKENWKALALRSKLLTFFTAGHSQLGAVLPMILMSPGYFAGIMTMGALWAAADAMGRLVDNLAYLIDRRADINELNACVLRVERL